MRQFARNEAGKFREGPPGKRLQELDNLWIGDSTVQPRVLHAVACCYRGVIAVGESLVQFVIASARRSQIIFLFKNPAIEVEGIRRIIRVGVAAEMSG